MQLYPKMVITLIGCIMFEELLREITLLIEGTEVKLRKRSQAAQLKFEHAVRTILLDLWNSVYSMPPRECLINKRSGYYSENPRYRDPLLTYRQTISAFNEKPKLQAHTDHQSGATYHQKHQIDISDIQADTARPDTKIDGFMRKMAMSESNGDPNTEITLEDGRAFTGLYQFGDLRLQDYRKATGAKFTRAEFQEDEALQEKVADWHFADIEDAIDALGSEADGYDRDGLKAIGHLGGVDGMRKYVRTKGQYNPSDALGTSLSDYYTKFSA